VVSLLSSIAKLSLILDCKAILFSLLLLNNSTTAVIRIMRRKRPPPTLAAMIKGRVPSKSNAESGRFEGVVVGLVLIKLNLSYNRC
jgi:hypothetical protein